MYLSFPSSAHGCPLKCNMGLSFWGSVGEFALLVLWQMSNRCFYMDCNGAALPSHLAAGPPGQLESGAIAGLWITDGERDG